MSPMLLEILLKGHLFSLCATAVLSLQEASGPTKQLQWISSFRVRGEQTLQCKNYTPGSAKGAARPDHLNTHNIPKLHPFITKECPGFLHLKIMKVRIPTYKGGNSNQKPQWNITSHSLESSAIKKKKKTTASVAQGCRETEILTHW